MCEPLAPVGTPTTCGAALVGAETIATLRIDGSESELNARLGRDANVRVGERIHLRPDLGVAELRGNVPTRVRKLRDGGYDAVVLAAAGLKRLELDLSGLEVRFLEPHLFVPAPAQGALALEVRDDDYDLASLLTDLHDPAAYKAVAAERGLMAMLEGGCQLALGAHAVLEGGVIELTVWYEGQKITVSETSSENVAMLAFGALGRPTPV